MAVPKLKATIVFSIVGLEFSPHQIPLPSEAAFPAKVQFVIVGEEELSQQIPPPPPDLPLTSQSLTEQLMMVGLEPTHRIPAPRSATSPLMMLNPSSLEPAVSELWK
jgi:hypothetical protein